LASAVDIYNHQSDLSNEELKCQDFVLDTLLLDTQLFTIVRGQDNQCVKESSLIYMKVNGAKEERRVRGEQGPRIPVLQATFSIIAAPELPAVSLSNDNQEARPREPDRHRLREAGRRRDNSTW